MCSRMYGFVVGFVSIQAVAAPPMRTDPLSLLQLSGSDCATAVVDLSCQFLTVHTCLLGKLQRQQLLGSQCCCRWCCCCCCRACLLLVASCWASGWASSCCEDRWQLLQLQLLISRATVPCCAAAVASSGCSCASGRRQAQQLLLLARSVCNSALFGTGQVKVTSQLIVAFETKSPCTVFCQVQLAWVLGWLPIRFLYGAERCTG